MLGLQPDLKASIWSAAEADTCTSNATLSSSTRCLPRSKSEIIKAPFGEEFTKLPAIFSYRSRISYTFSCEREVGRGTTLHAQIEVSEAEKSSTIASMNLSPTLSAERRSFDIEIKQQALELTVTVNPNPKSSYYGECSFSEVDIEFLPDLTAIEWYADTLIDQMEFASRVNSILKDALESPEGWEKSGQIIDDITAHRNQTTATCRRNLRQVSRILKLDFASISDSERHTLDHLTGSDYLSLQTEAEGLLDAEAVCTAKLPTPISGEIDRQVKQYLQLEDVLEKAKVLTSFENCEKESSEICRSAVEDFRQITLQAFRLKNEEESLSLQNYLRLEIDRLQGKDQAAAARIDSILQDVRNLEK